ncbi:BMP family lipoprotein [Nocardiopsis ansamitocini]|uniref:BMP family ABC transporter substrate-binding protein n=1 Tax=Nocardiopsis ansamitocini TaxID=1670832 RepID=A0A9W6UIM0_9ACTN|nr:BMP family ABC transporter substrate-binding protein [Nocardiopsis ansamitocini]GLU47837.1 BMP family ABC transporter substrate-binding protein [Nocardiopsis ansamitocini]
MKRNTVARLGAMAAAGVLALAMTACDSGSGTDEGTAGGDGATAESDIRVGLAYDIGGKGDKSFNDSAYRGLERVKDELGITDAQDLEPTDGEPESAKEERLALMAEEGYNVVIAVGFAYDAPVRAVAPEFPDVQFAIVDSEIEDIDNVTSLVFTEEQASFLAGAAAALKSEEDHIGFIGGVETPLIKKFEAGYAAGAQEINPDITIEVAYLTQPPDFGGFQDPSRGEATAEGQYDAGADVIYHAAGASGNGVLNAAEAKDKLFIGVDSDQYEGASDAQKPFIVTSALKGVDTAVFEFVSGIVDGSAEGGIQRFDLASGGVDYATSNSEEISDIQGELDALKQQIIDGEITVPTAP